MRLVEAGCLFCPLLSLACHCVSPLFVELHSSTTFSHSFIPSSSPSLYSKLLPLLSTLLFISSVLHPLTLLHIYSAEKLPICPLASRTLLFCPFTLLVLPFPLSPTSCPYYTLPLAPPTQPNHLFLSSPLQKATLISPAETLVSSLPGQGSTIAHFTHDRVCCMPVMYVCF